MNRTILIGNLTRDPELKYLPNGGTAVSNYSMAVANHFKKGEDGKPTADFFNIVTFGKPAESIANHMKKGCKIAVEGRLQTRTWEDQQGNKRYATEIVTDNVEFLSFPPKDGVQNSNNQEFASLDGDEDIPF